MVLTFANLVSRALFSGFCPPPKPAKSTLGTVVGRLHMVRGTNFHKLAGATSSLTYDVFLSKLAFTTIKALFQVVSVDFPFTWSRSTGRGRVSTLSVPGFHMQGHCNTRKIYSNFEKGGRKKLCT